VEIDRPAGDFEPLGLLRELADLLGIGVGQTKPIGKEWIVVLATAIEYHLICRLRPGERQLTLEIVADRAVGCRKQNIRNASTLCTW